jgi:hypothetical protein
MREIQMSHGFCYVTRLIRIESARLAFTHRAKTAMPRADIPTEHERCRAIRPALENVRTLRFLANGVQVQAFNQLEQMVLIRRVAQTNLQPLGLWLPRPGDAVIADYP